MSRVPVGRTIAGAYSFTFSNLLSILGIVWLPYAVLILLFVGAVFVLAPDVWTMLAGGQFDFWIFARLRHVFGILWLLGLIVTAMITVGLQCKALGLHPGPVFFYFSLGAPVWRMVAALFLAGLVIVFIGLVTAGIAAALWFAAGNYLPDVAVWIRAAAIAVAVCWIIYLIVRLVFFLPAVVVAEKRIGLERAWILGGGNFWRIFVVWLAVFLPVAIVFSIVSSALFGSFVALPGLSAHMTLQEILHALVLQFRVVGPFMLLVQLVERLVLLGMLNGAIASAYLAVSAQPHPAAAANPLPPTPA